MAGGEPWGGPDFSPPFCLRSPHKAGGHQALQTSWGQQMLPELTSLTSGPGSA